MLSQTCPVIVLIVESFFHFSKATWLHATERFNIADLWKQRNTLPDGLVFPCLALPCRLTVLIV
jgi:hypothetical protein